MYKFRCCLAGHQKDVRALCSICIPDGSFVSGSRDLTSRLWSTSGSVYSEVQCFRGHSNFISAVCCMPPNEKYPNGLIFTGSNDSNILAFSLDAIDPLYKLFGHTDTVCCLAAGKFGTLISGSWDATAKVWLNQKNVMTLSGHEASVWAVGIMPEQGYMITGSADKSIKIWKAGKCERTLKGHTDCVRGIAVLSGVEFLSCSNDATVRRWLISGECVQTYYGHSNFIYSIAILPNGQDFVTSGEDRTMRVWKGGECVQTITHPATSVWTVCTLSNGDVITGSSDGMIRIFSESPDRIAEPEQIQQFEEEVSASTIPSQVGDVKMEDLPGPEVLTEPGEKDGFVRLVRVDNKAEAHQWNAAESRWIKIGDVTGSSGGSQETSGKVLYEGKEYDYVFDVDIEEGKPPLKLPYNRIDDPWHVAQQFIYKHNLSQLFLDQIANFIVDNAKGGANVGSTAPTQSYVDPFTGGGRYVPGSSSEDNAAIAARTNIADPFTGGGRYIPGSVTTGSSVGSNSGGGDPFTGASSYRTGGSSQAQPVNNIPKYFPKSDYIFSDAANIAAIVGKMKELNEKLDGSLRVDAEYFTELSRSLENSNFSQNVLQILSSLLKWPRDSLLPILDAIRLALRTADATKYFLNQTFLQFLINTIETDAVLANQLLALRILGNLFRYDDSCMVMVNQRDSVISAALHLKEKTNKSLQIALSTLLLNYSIAMTKYNRQDMEAMTQCLLAITSALHTQKDHEASFRLLVSIGNLIMVQDSVKDLTKSLDILPRLVELSAVSEPQKLGSCAQSILKIIQ
ncbi:phospholipase A-2-activating protein-like [Tubulanus polymorphus]|uniref:phospholipase A-2-activating protein-like n=1 Tax=Tubulanus polymorphus TaxID=672921 RepID=UPI003DA58E12